MGYSAAVIPVRGENRNSFFKMTLKMVARAQIEKRGKRHAIKRLTQAASNRHSRCMSPFVAQSGRPKTSARLSAFGAKADIHAHVASTASVVNDP
jgi:hypothetical protein